MLTVEAFLAVSVYLIKLFPNGYTALFQFLLHLRLAIYPYGHDAAVRKGTCWLELNAVLHLFEGNILFIL